MLLMMPDEFDATGALAISWFHGLSPGNNCWPSSVGTTRSSSASSSSVLRFAGRWVRVLSSPKNRSTDNDPLPLGGQVFGSVWGTESRREKHFNWGRASWQA